MDHERLGRAVWAAELRRKGTLLSDEAVADVCEALLEVAGDGTITLELHEQLMGQLRAETEGLRILAAAETEHANKWAARANQAEARVREIEGRT